MRVIVYVEGPSDQKALEVLLHPVILTAQQRGIAVRFSAQNGKAPIMNSVPRTAANHLSQHTEDWVFAVPDLYPARPHGHQTFDELRRILRGRFETRANEVGLSEDTRTHFRVHCLKHDLEALVLAATDVLRMRLKTQDTLRDAWRQPVENQNDDRPPKKVVEELFKKYRKKPRYVDTTDAVWILGRARLDDIVEACPQCFAPFVRELRALAEGRMPDESTS